MDTDETMVTPEAKEDESIIPDGYGDKDDIFRPAKWSGAKTESGAESESDTDEESEDDPLSSLLSGGTEDNKAGKSKEVAKDKDVPTTDTPPEDGDKGDEGETAPTTEPETNAPKKLKFKVRVDHEEKDAELDESELPSLYQKAQVTERVQERLKQTDTVLGRLKIRAKARGFDSFEAMLQADETAEFNAAVDELTESGVHPEVARDLVSRKMGRTEDFPAAPAPKAAPAAAESEPESEIPERDFQAEVAELLRERPDALKPGEQLPEEVTKACLDGKSLLVAYSEYEEKRAKAERDRVLKENAVLKQNAASAAKAPVKGTNGGGSTAQKAKDSFEQGFDSID